MTAGADVTADAADMGTAGLRGRSALDVAVVRNLSERSDARGLIRFAVHLLAMACTASLVYVAQPSWQLLIPAMTLHGFTLVSMFAPMHECVHRTAFASRWCNELFGWFAGLLSFYNFTYYRLYHTWHHRYTQDPDRDPELATPKPRNLLEYLLEVSGANFWTRRPGLFLRLALGRTRSYPFIPDASRRRVAASVAAQLAVYAAGIISIAMGIPFALYFWFLPVLLAQPLLRLLLIAEHTGCSQDENGLTNTRTTLTRFPIRLLMWNMPFHAEHHLYPSIPFHRLPQAHEKLREKLAFVAPGYVAANCSIIHSLRYAPGQRS